MVTTTREIFAIASREKPMTSPDIQPPVVVTQQERMLARQIVAWAVSGNGDKWAEDRAAAAIAKHRLSTLSSMQARIEELESEVERWARAQGMSFNQAMANGQDADAASSRSDESPVVEDDAPETSLGGSNDR